jgi:serine/threonine-protein kinase
MPDIVGKTLKDFFVLRRLGRGAMAEVYLAQQLSLGRQVALKVLNAELARDANCVRRFQHEARAAAALIHASIVQIYEVGAVDGIHYIAQEYVPGSNVGEVIRSRGSLPPPLVLDILRQVTAALSKAAAEGIVHRDIKPENIMLSPGGDVKVADFGLARVQGDGGPGLTQVGVTMGTPLYMSPEQIEGRELDSRSDIYSLGVTAYHMLAGEPPFSGDVPLTVAVKHLKEQPPPLVARRPDVPPGFAGLVERMMAKNPADRFSDPASLLGELIVLSEDGAKQGWATRPDHSSLAALLQAADQRSAATSRLDEVMRTAALVRPKRWSPRRIAAALVLCALVGVGLAALTRPRSLLAGASVGPPPQESVWAQLYLAKDVDTEDAWKAVYKYFDDEPVYYHNLARQGLAYYFLERTQNYDRAIEPLTELASQPDFKAFGIAGLVVVYTRLGDDEQADLENQQLSPEMRATLKQQSPRMAELLQDALKELALRAT